MMNDRLRAQVAAELSWDPKVDSTDITVSAEGGMVTLHGTVASCRQKREADNAARRVYGVAGISNYLEVHIPDQGKRADQCRVRAQRQAGQVQGVRRLPASRPGRSFRDGQLLGRARCRRRRGLVRAGHHRRR